MASESPVIGRGRVQLPDCHGRPTCDPTPVCPACGGLECLCRPRFFAGQLLTEEDLNRLDYYIQAKHRLHNRHLHGWGVVCGLEVVCGVCEPDQRHVLVKPGYALSPCGNDIVVCRPASVDVCDLIDRCRPPADECYDLIAPPSPRDPAIGAADPHGTGGDHGRFGDCEGGTEEWVLAICYMERPSRGVAALRANVCDCGCGGECGGGCGCGGNGKKGGCGCGSGGGHHGHNGGGCGCKGSHSHGSKKPPRASSPRTVPEQCEPTVTCEGYRFVVYKVPRAREREREFGQAAKRFLCCLAPLLEELDAIDENMTPQQAQQWVIAFRDAVREFVLHEGLYDCDIAKRLAMIVIPSVKERPANHAIAHLNQTAVSIAAIARLILQKCLCAAFLPPCPEPSQTDCVPLAAVTVARDKCRVIRVCNLSARKFLVTWPAIGYWLSFLSLGSSFRRIFERICCRPIDIDDRLRGAVFFRTAADTRDAARRRRARAGAGEGPTTAPPPTERDVAALLWRAIANPDPTVDVENVLLGAVNARDAEGKPFATPDELAHPTEFILLNRVVVPLLQKLAPAEGVPPSVSAGLGAAGRVDDLAREVEELKATVERQQKTINELKRRR